jgi:lactate dehydrogenase-like 2-hydroxyacid dehydrogenase
MPEPLPGTGRQRGSPRHTVLVTRRQPEAVEHRVARDYKAVLNPDDSPLTEDELAVRSEDADAIVCCVTDRFSRALISQLGKRVQLLASASVGMDHIDLQAARDRGLRVTNTPGVVTEATADIALLLLLGAARRAAEGEQLVRSGRWTGWAPTQLLGRGFRGKRLGIVGMGRIGRAFAERARPLGLELHYCNRTQLTAAQAQGAQFHETLESLLRVSDFLSLHTPATAATRHLMNARTLALLPPGAILVNSARGDLVDDEALVGALRSGRLFAAGLDVYEGEPAVHAGYRTLPNVFLLPHLGTATLETREAMGFRALDNVDALLSGREPPDAVA